MTSVLISGANGFIGSSLGNELRARGHEVHELSHDQGDIAESSTLEHAPPVKHVFHLAGRSFVPDSWTDPDAFIRTNVLGTMNVLEFCRRHGARLTFVSAYLYGAPETLPVSETAVPKPNNPYALSKYLAEQACSFYAKYYGIHIVVIRPFNVYGPGQKKHFLIPEIIKQVRDGREIRVKDLAPRRDFVFVDDLVDAVTRTLGGPDGYQVFNVGSGASVSVQELVNVIQRVAGTRLAVVCEGTIRPNEIDDVYADIRAARRSLGWTPSCRLEQGVERVLAAQ